ncbi:MAG: hypothetical protein M9962_15450 [Oligoflexia bacterium]|nr:hypothetical protein [Oligoflexia bacterium]
MGSSEKLKPFILVTILILSLSTVIGFQKTAPLNLDKYRSQQTFNEGIASFSAESLRLMSFGYDRLLSNLLWLRFLQYTPVEKVPPGQVSWIYLDLDTITNIDPDFYPAYEHGGIFLSVITEDKKGAEKLLLKGTERLPNRWRIFAYLAYHYQNELKDIDKGYEFYAKASKISDAPAFLNIFASNYYAKKYSIQSSIDFLESLLLNTKEEHMKKRILDKIQKLKNEGR